MQYIFHRVFIHIKAINKARLYTVVTLGPVVIDFTPPKYDSGLELETGKMMTLRWPISAFYDDEDTSLIIDYQWALGKYPAH